jgi:hypothetical protein
MTRLVAITHGLLKTFAKREVPDEEVSRFGSLGAYVEEHNRLAVENGSARYNAFLVRDTGDGTVAAELPLPDYTTSGTALDIQEVPSFGGTIGVVGLAGGFRAFRVTITVGTGEGGSYLAASPTYCDPVLVRERGYQLSNLDGVVEGALIARLRELCRGGTHVGVARALEAMLLAKAATHQRLANHHLRERAAALDERESLARVFALGEG